MRDRRLIICALLSVLGHLAFAAGMARLPRRVEAHPRPATVAIRVVAPPPPEPPPEPAKPAPPPPRVVPQPRPRPRPTPTPETPPPPTPPPPDSPPPEPTPGNGPSTTPVFGVTMESTSQAGSGPALPVGNSVRAPARRDNAPAAAAPALAAPVPIYEASKLPLPLGNCTGRYTEEAKAAGIEGTVVLDLVVGENGRVREVKVVRGLGYGLTEAAVAALKDCRFSPGEKDGKPVPMAVRGFKYTFVRPE